MSEYQYYEFQAIDKPLTAKEMQELRSYSTRARITPTSFVNDYSWGSFKGDEDAWMEKYFDAFLYIANWGTHIFKLRLPSSLLDLKIAKRYCPGRGAFANEKNGKVILTFASEDEDGDEWIEGEGLLSSLISVRAEIAGGDLRGLYLGWLLCVQNDELDEEEIEPPVPPGLGKLSASLESLVDFLRIDPHLLQVAAQESRTKEEAPPRKEEVREWIGKLLSGEKDELLARIIMGKEISLAKELFYRFIWETKTGDREIAKKGQGRAAGELLGAAEELAEEQRRLAVRKAAEEKAKRDREAAIKRERYLREISKGEPELWKRAEDLAATKQPKNYDQAVNLLLDLRDVAAGKNRLEEFRSRLETLRSTHVKKPSLLKRMANAGL